jgi:Holliday junction resolvasome RuvABC endonuclease subunit
MIVMGNDPGWKNWGWCICEIGKEIEVIETGCETLYGNKNILFQRKVDSLINFFKRIFEKYPVDIVLIEEQFSQKFLIESYKLMLVARGALTILNKQNYYINPKSVKKFFNISGTGKEKKKQTESIFEKYKNESQEKDQFIHVADALGVVFFYYNKSSF